MKCKLCVFCYEDYCGEMYCWLDQGPYIYAIVNRERVDERESDCVLDAERKAKLKEQLDG